MIPNNGFSSQFRPKQRNPDSIIRDFFKCGIQYPGFFCAIRYPGLWNGEFSSRIRKLTNDWNPETRFQWQRIGIQYLESRIQNCLGFPFIERTIFVACLLPFHLPFQIWRQKMILSLDPRLVIVEWNQILFEDLRIRIFCVDYFVNVAPFRSIQLRHARRCTSLDKGWKWTYRIWFLSHGLAIHWYNNFIISPERAIRR